MDAIIFFFQKMQCFIVYMQGKLLFFLFRVFALHIYIKMTKQGCSDPPLTPGR